MENTLYYLHTLSALHVGIGQGSGIIDLPIAREKATSLPQVPGSGVKGVLRDEYGKSEDHLALFGPETGEDASAYGGALAVGDGRLIALPVRSWKGTFAWATSPMLLERYRRGLAEINAEGYPEKVPVVGETQAHYPIESALVDDDKIYLEDLDLDAVVCDDTASWANWIGMECFKSDDTWQQLFKTHFLLLPDNLFDFLAETATEIRARIRIDGDTGTVQDGALWYQEYLPAETLLWGVLACDRAKNGSAKSGEDLLTLLNDMTLQVGGDATTGSGQSRWIRRKQE